MVPPPCGVDTLQRLSGSEDVGLRTTSVFAQAKARLDKWSRGNQQRQRRIALGLQPLDGRFKSHDVGLCGSDVVVMVGLQPLDPVCGSCHHYG